MQAFKRVTEAVSITSSFECNVRMQCMAMLVKCTPEYKVTFAGLKCHICFKIISFLILSYK